MKKEFSRVHSTKDIVLTTVITVAGCVLVALPTSSSINILGFFMIAAGLILAFILKTGYKDVETGERYCKTEKFFAQSLKHDVATAIETNPEKVDITEEDKGNGIRLDIYYSRKTGKAYAQLFEYIPYKYEPCTIQFEHELKSVEKLLVNN